MKKNSILLIIVWISCCAFLDGAPSLNEKANKLYQDKKYQSATELYRKAQVKAPNQPEVLYNLGTALYQTDQFDESSNQLQKAIEQNKADKSLLAKNWYNYGNTQYRLGNFEKSIEAYKKALEYNSKDQDSKYNLEMLLKKKSMFEKRQEERNKEDKKKQDKPNQQQKKDQASGGSSGSQQDQNSQGQQDQKKDQKEQQDNTKEGQEDQKKPDKEKQDESKPQPKPDQQQEQQKQDQQQNQQNEPKDQQDQQDKKDGGKEADQYFQGQMSKADANRILDALKESEKEMQVYRQPKKKEGRPPEQFSGKDW